MANTLRSAIIGVCGKTEDCQHVPLLQKIFLTSTRTVGLIRRIRYKLLLTVHTMIINVIFSIIVIYIAPFPFIRYSKVLHIVIVLSHSTQSLSGQD